MKKTTSKLKQRVKKLLDDRHVAGLTHGTEIRFTQADKEEIELADKEVLGTALASLVRKSGCKVLPAFAGLKITGWDATETTIS